MRLPLLFLGLLLYKVVSIFMVGFIFKVDFILNVVLIFSSSFNFRVVLILEVLFFLRLSLPTKKPSMDKKMFGQVLLLSTLTTYPKSLKIFELKFVLKRILSYFCNDTFG